MWRYFKTQFQQLFLLLCNWVNVSKAGKIDACIGTSQLGILRKYLGLTFEGRNIGMGLCSLGWLGILSKSKNQKNAEREREIELESGIYANQHLQPHNHSQSRICQSCWCQSVFDSGDHHNHHPPTPTHKPPQPPPPPLMPPWASLSSINNF